MNPSDPETPLPTPTTTAEPPEKHHFWDSWPVVGKHDQVSADSPKTGDTTPIPSGLEQAAANAPSAEVAAATASVDTGSIDTSIVPQEAGSIPATINNSAPTSDETGTMVGAPTPLVLSPDAPTPPPVQIPEKPV